MANDSSDTISDHLANPIAIESSQCAANSCANKFAKCAALHDAQSDADAVSVVSPDSLSNDNTNFGSNECSDTIPNPSSNC